jgi:hypothetical protein
MLFESLICSRRWRFATVRAAVFGVVLNALAPTVTALLAHAEGRAVALPQHCLIMAAQEGEMDAPATPATPSQKKAASCPFCFAHAGSFGAAPAVVGLPASNVMVTAAANSRAVVPPASRSWLTARSRAPPVLS